MTTHECDVLVAGGGGAGLRAAIAAREASASVILASKTAVGVENCTGYAWGGLSGAVRGRTPDDYLATLLDKGANRNDPALARLLAERSGPALDELARFGVEIKLSEGRGKVEGRPMRGGEGLTMPMLWFARHLGAQVHTGSMLLQLLQDDGRIVGALGLDLTNGSLIHYECGAIVIATGGGAGMFAHSDNPAGTTGDGYWLALEAGAELVDMAFLQTIPLGLAEPGLPFDGCNFGAAIAAGELQTLDGKPIARGDCAAHFEAAGERLERDDDRFDLLLDLRGVTDEEWAEGSLREMRQLLLGDFPVGEKPVRVSPLAHYMPGGIKIDGSCSAGVPGLFAAGEVVGGIFGAGRPGGGALTDTVVFGALAGEAAAEHSARRERSGSASLAHDAEARWTALLGHADARHAPERIRSEAGEALWNYCSVVRHGEGLRRCVAWLDELADEADGMRAESPMDLRTLFEARVAVEIGRRIAEASG